jgi:hypothetical protein
MRSARPAGAAATSIFDQRNAGLVTQDVPWLPLTGVSFVVSADLQVVRGCDTAGAGVILTATTTGLLASSFGAERFAERRPAAPARPRRLSSSPWRASASCSRSWPGRLAAASSHGSARARDRHGDAVS